MIVIVMMMIVMVMIVIVMFVDSDIYDDRDDDITRDSMHTYTTYLWKCLFG